MDIGKLLQGQLDLASITDLLSADLGADKEQVSKASSALLPELLSAMNKNVKSEKGLDSLFSALDDHKDVDVSNASAFLKNVDLADGQKILGHLLGNKTEEVEKKVAKESGLKGKQVKKMMLMLAPMLMGFLGSQKKKQSGFDQKSLLTMLAGLAGGSGLSSLLTSLGGSKQKSSKKKGLDVSDAVDLVGSLLKKNK